MKGLDIGGLTIPIIYEKRIDTAPPTGTQGYFNIPGHATADETYGGDAHLQTVVGYDCIVCRAQVMNPAGPDPTTGSVDEYLRAGVIDAHNGATYDFVWTIDPGTYVVPAHTLKIYADANDQGRAEATFVNIGGFYDVVDDTGSSHFIYVVAARNVYNDDTIAGYTIFRVRRIEAQSGPNVTVTYTNVGSTDLNLWAFKTNDNITAYLEEVDIPEPEEPPFDPSDDNRYIPFKDDTSDEIPLPSDPVIGVTNAGFINVYKPAMNALTGLGDILFPNVASATDIVDAVIKLCETLANQNLINYVIDCHVIPVTPVTGGNNTIKVGYRNTGISVPVVTSDYVNVSCGALNIREYFGGFADYVATRSKIYLPFIGFVDTRPEFWQAGTIAIDYKFNVIDGSFMAYIRSTSSKSQLTSTVIAQYAGNACMHFPLTGVNYSSMVSGIVGAAVTAASSGTSSAVLGSALSAANAIAQGGDVQQSNGYNSTAAILGVRKPYLMIERAVPSYSSIYMHDKGYPSNIAAVLSTVSGYTEIEDIDLSGIPFTEAELTELRTLLKEGVYF